LEESIRSAGTQYYKNVIQSSGWRYGQQAILAPYKHQP
jgi:hypothetical protein